ncbi:Uma2 family endonuclease [Thermostichus vulcanus]|uniref:Uma2 family endonuclease n=1 Tax=Thermostichus vulcanus str. 'Rupite' TaxID=2813851 RepID=A0ABT0CF83_THEVL|nr:Uma2 family endonuclease [Thermostichus vulcanus]MCJ2544442.1 Uma2 family endonuclease [Thermostichus vulcanus str. 'Rupite']
MTATGVRWTTRDIEALPENEWIRYEIIDGELLVTRSPHHKHQHIIGCLFSALHRWSLETGLGEPSIMPGILFSDSDNVSPDVIWVSYEHLPQIQDEAGHFCGAPELVAEVLLPGRVNEDRDRLAKLKLYSVRGVQEYWIVDRLAQRIEIYRRQHAQLVLVETLLAPDRLSSPLLPGFTCTVSELFVSRF